MLRRCLLAAVAVFVVSAGAMAEVVADRVVVDKTERKLRLYSGSDVMQSFDIALGLMPEGHKEREGDSRTPEGDYLLTNRLIDSDFFMAIQVSYPNPDDIAKADRLGVSPGGAIMIHGQPTRPRKSAAYYAKYDWTDGCIAVSNAAMVAIWQLTKPNTPITILP